MFWTDLAHVAKMFFNPTSVLTALFVAALYMLILGPVITWLQRHAMDKASPERLFRTICNELIEAVTEINTNLKKGPKAMHALRFECLLRDGLNIYGEFKLIATSFDQSGWHTMVTVYVLQSPAQARLLPLQIVMHVPEGSSYEKLNGVCAYREYQERLTGIKATLANAWLLLPVPAAHPYQEVQVQ